MLKNEVMAVDEWHNYGPQDIVTVSLCIQIATDKMQLCSLSVAYTCPYQHFRENMCFVRMEHFLDFLFQLMKHGTKTLHIVFIFLFSVDFSIE